MNLFLTACLTSGLFLILLITSCQSAKQSQVFPDRITVKWRLIENQHQDQSQHLSELTFTNNGSIPLKNDDWALYFNWFRRPASEKQDKRIIATHINGDFYEIKPTSSFPDLHPGDSVSIPLIASHYVISETDAPSGAYFVWHEGGKEQFRPVKIVIQPLDHTKLFRSEKDKVPVWTPELQYRQNKRWNLTDHAIGRVTGIIPSPVQAELRENTVTISASWSLEYDQASEDAVNWFKMEFGKRVPGFPAKESENTLILRVNPESFSGDAAREEAYRVTIADKKIMLIGYDAAGVFYGLQTLIALSTEDEKKKAAIILPAAEITDYPRFAYRGMHIDVARNFHEAAIIRQIIDEMAHYKLNRLHFHLTDDEGWRIEIPGLPELTEVGAFRGHTLQEKEHLVPSLGSGPYKDAKRSMGSGYYTRAVFIELLKYAHERHVLIIPEIDLPGHAHAAIVAMDARHRKLLAEGRETDAKEYLLYHPDDTLEYESIQKWKNNVVDAGMESTYRFFEKVVNELKSMYEAAGVPLQILHIGGDEVPEEAWTASPAARALLESNPSISSHHDLFEFFVNRAANILDKHGIRTAGWEEIGMEIKNNKKVPNPDVADRGFIPYVWNSVWGWGGEDLAYRLANQGFDVVLSSVTNLYLDLAYNKHPKEPGLYWGGFVTTKNTWEFTPSDVKLCAETDLNGHPIDVQDFDRFEALNPAAESNLIGIQGQLWGENVRSTERLHYLMFPKLLALAERSWSPKPLWEKQKSVEEKEKEWSMFVSILSGQEMPRLTQRGIKYRVPLPGAIIENNTLYMNNAYQGLVPYYRFKDGTATKYTRPLQIPDHAIGLPIQVWNSDKKGHPGRKSWIKAEKDAK